MAEWLLVIYNIVWRVAIMPRKVVTLFFELAFVVGSHALEGPRGPLYFLVLLNFVG